MLAFHFENLQHVVTSFTRSWLFFFGCQAAGIPSWAFQFAHFIPSQRPDGWGCSNGPELDVAPPSRGAYTTLSQTESWSCYCLKTTTATESSKPLGRPRKLFAIHGDDAAWCHFFLTWIKLIQLASSLFIILHKCCTTDITSRFCFCVRKAHRGEVRFWKRSWSWWAWTSQQQDCMYFFTWGANAEWKDPLLGNILVGKKNPCVWHFCISMIPILFRLAAFLHFLSLSLSVDFFRRKRCIQNENFTTSQVLAGLPSLPLENLLLGPNILEKQRWLQL